MLDLELAKQTTPVLADRESFTKYARLLVQLREDEVKKAELENFVTLLQQILANLAIQLDNAETRPDVQSFVRELTSARQKLNDMVSLSKMKST